MRELVDGAAGTLAWFLTVVTIVGVVAAPLLVLMFAPGFRVDEGKFDLTVEMLRWTFPYLLFISLAALAARRAQQLRQVRRAGARPRR